MAGLNLIATTGKINVTAAKTWLGITAPAHQRVKIKSVELFGFGTSNTDTPVQLDIIAITTDGTGTAGTFNPVDQDTTETPQSTFKTNYSAEPTYGNTLRTLAVHPQTGLAVFFPLNEEIVLKGGGMIGFKLTPNQSEFVVLNVQIEE